MIKPNSKNKVFIETYGCQMNEYDSELVKAILAEKKYAFTKNELEADIIMLNTCAIRENAHRKIYGRVHEIRHNRRKRLSEERGDPKLLNKHEKLDGPLIGLLGCMVTNLRKELLEDKTLNIDFIAGPDSYKKLPKLIEECLAEEGSKKYDVTLSEFETYSDIFPNQNITETTLGAGENGMPTNKKSNAWIAVSRGCNNFCTFCVVPYTRGRERSRALNNIVEEAKRLADNGFKQITLLGQNVNSYNHDGHDFADLMQAVADIKGIERVRFTSPHPKDFPLKLLKIIAAHPKICKQIHLPLQSGSSRVLDAMNRTYSKEEFLNLVKIIRETIPGIAFSTDIIVGFPTETEAEFEETAEVMEKVEFDSAFIFKYSERKNTIAFKKMPDDITEDIKTARIMRLNEIQQKHSYASNLANVGETQVLLIERETTYRSDQLSLGRNDANKLVYLPRGTFKEGDFIIARITDATPHNLKGVPT